MKLVTSNNKQSTRDVILHTLKVAHQAKVEELAEAADVSPVTVRHHLNSLQADGLVEVTSVRRKVGRPYYIYCLSEKGEELFPQKYVRLTNRLLEALKNHLSDDALTDLFSGIVQTIIDEHRGQFENLSFEKKLDYLIGLLKKEGFLAQWEKVNGQYRITEYSCPYYSVGSVHHEVCFLDRELIVTVLQTPVEQHSCMLDGDNCCHFTFSLAAAETAAS